MVFSNRVLLLGYVAAVVHAFGATSGSPQATMTCPPVAVAGRVLCEVNAQIQAGESLQWGDVILVRVPSFVFALRGRIGPHDAGSKSATNWRWSFALVAHGVGRGSMEALVRLVVCRGDICVPREEPVVSQIVVGR